MQTSLIIGGNRGIGSVVVSSLKKRGDIIYTASRKSSEEEPSTPNRWNGIDTKR